MSKKKKQRQRYLRLLGLVVFFFILLILSLEFLYQKYHQNRFYSGLSIAKISLGGRTKEVAKKLVEERIKEINQKGFVFSIDHKNMIVSPVGLLSFNLDQALDNAYLVGRRKNLLLNLKEQLEALLRGRKIKMNFDLAEKELDQALKDNLKDFEAPSLNPQIVLNNNQIIISSEQIGESLDYQGALKETVKELQSLHSPLIKISKLKTIPLIKKEEVIFLLPQLERIVGKTPLVLKYQDKSYLLTKENLVGWLEFQKEESGKEETYLTRDLSQNGVKLDLNKEKVIGWLNQIAQDIDRTPQSAKFNIENGRVREFEPARAGKTLDKERTFDILTEELFETKTIQGNPSTSSGTKEINLVVKIQEAVSEKETDDFGIKEIIGKGISNFKGSPKNRRHNIKIGAQALNGLLIKPAEEFSLVKALGEISAKSGYLPELVIKGNKTIPEYGGGLCQIGTTVFRAALASGLPILERQNHSYRVPYYEPAGVDATIYNPKPDFKFLNDTNNYILIQSKIYGDDLIFEFWGTKDQRLVVLTKPKIYNIVKPGPAKVIETADLKPGEKKCLEKAHTGAEAEFTYTVTYVNGQVKSRIFKSYYKPWRAVCLIGKKEAPAIEPAEISPESANIKEKQQDVN